MHAWPDRIGAVKQSETTAWSPTSGHFFAPLFEDPAASQRGPSSHGSG